MKTINPQLIPTTAKSGITMEEAVAQAIAEQSGNTDTPAPAVVSQDAASLETRAKSGSIDPEAVKARAAELMVENNGVLSTAVAQNKEAALLAAKITTGDVVVGQLSKRIAPKLPMMVRGYADSEIGHVVFANLISTALTQYKPGDKRAQYVSEAVMASAAVNLAKSFDINGLIDEILDGVTLPLNEK